MLNLNTQHDKLDLGIKYLNSFKVEALSTDYKTCLTNSYQKIWLRFEYSLVILKIKHNQSHLVFFSSNHVTSFNISGIKHNV